MVYKKGQSVQEERDMSTNFKTNMFGGFDKADVVAYIERVSKDKHERLESLNRENEDLRAKNTELTRELRILRQQVSILEDNSATVTSLRSQLDDMMRRAESAEREAMELRQPAAEYQRMKDHIADIEISAHRRTEEFRAQAMAELQGLIDRQRHWCREQQNLFDGVRQEMLQGLTASLQSVERTDLTAFQTMQDALTKMEQELKTE